MKELVGYSNETGEQLRAELLAGANNNQAQYSRKNAQNEIGYMLYIELGITFRHTVETYLYVDSVSKVPRFVTLVPTGLGGQK